MRAECSKSHQALCLGTRHQGAGTESETPCQRPGLQEQRSAPGFRNSALWVSVYLAQDNSVGANLPSTHLRFRQGTWPEPALSEK